MRLEAWLPGQLKVCTLGERAASDPDRKKGIAVTGSVIGAVLASSCCIVPLALITLGVSGAWIGKLTALKPYQPLFVTLTVGFLGYGFWRAYGKPRQACDKKSCGTPISDRLVKVALWSALLLVIVSFTTDSWAPIFY